jgi:hypothetical protein
MERRAEGPGLAPSVFPAMDIFSRPPSEEWEPVNLPTAPGAAVWAWFRPPAAPYGIIFQIAPESHDSHPKAFTVRRLLNALGVDCRQTQMCHACSGSFDAMNGMNPKLDKPLCAPPPGSDPAVTIHLAPPTSMAAPRTVAPSAAAMSSPVIFAAAPVTPVHGAEHLYHAIESDWQAIQLLESKNLMLRTQLNSTLSRLMSLNRDLSPDERNASDTVDHRDWQEARRWIRDGAAVLTRVVKSHDIGVTSAAGNRNRFDDIVDHYVAPRHPLPNLHEIQHQFEVHRKTVQSLHTEMQNAAHGPAHEGESRAQSVLNRIKKKMLAKRTNR